MNEPTAHAPVPPLPVVSFDFLSWNENELRLIDGIFSPSVQAYRPPPMKLSELRRPAAAAHLFDPPLHFDSFVAAMLKKNEFKLFEGLDSRRYLVDRFNEIQITIFAQTKYLSYL